MASASVTSATPNAPTLEPSPQQRLYTKWVTKHIKEPKTFEVYVENFDSLEIRARPWLRVALIVTFVAVMVIGIMAITGKLISFPQNVAHGLTHMNWVKLSVGLSATFVLFTGASLVITRALNHLDPIVKRPGKFSGDAHWEPVWIPKLGPLHWYLYVDKSTLDSEGSGKVYAYARKDLSEHYSVSFEMSVCALPRMVGSVIWNVIRLFVIPFYILACVAIEKCRGEPIHEGDPFKLAYIPRELLRSISKIVRAPFYGIAHLFAMFYSLIDPLNGRKLGAVIERLWNNDTTRAEAWWSVGGPQKCFIRPWNKAWWSPSQLGKNNFRAAGCHDAFFVLDYEKGTITDCRTLSHATQILRNGKGDGERYVVITKEMLQSSLTHLNATPPVSVAV